MNTSPATNGSREAILKRIREALRTPATIKKEITSITEKNQQWLPAVSIEKSKQIEIFAANCVELRAEFFRFADLRGAAEHFAQMARENNWGRIATHAHPLAEALLEGGGAQTEILRLEAGYDRDALAACDAGITGCECLVAQTGSVLVTAASSGGRVLSVLPPHHVVVATGDQIVADLTEAYVHVRSKYNGEVPAFLSFITGPSRTGDIERILVLGAHGPKRLTILLVDP